MIVQGIIRENFGDLVYVYLELKYTPKNYTLTINISGIIQGKYFNITARERMGKIMLQLYQ